MLAEIGDKVFIVKWNHENNGRDEQSVTRCFIRNAANKEVVCSGVSICDTRDQYNKQIGRKISLSRALKNFPDVNDRKVFWHSYDTEIGLVK